jgi:hypothetical protein
LGRDKQHAICAEIRPDLARVGREIEERREMGGGQTGGRKRNTGSVYVIALVGNFYLNIMSSLLK